jgi:hypothetical protein
MNSKFTKLTISRILFVLMLCADLASAQQAAPTQLKLATIALPDGLTVLVGQAAIQDELQLNDVQKDSITRFTDKATSERRDLVELQLTQKEIKETAAELAAQHAKALEAILPPQQFKRLTEVTLQFDMSRNWNTTLANKLADKLSLTEEQKKTLLDLHQKQIKTHQASIIATPLEQKLAKSRAVRAEQKIDSLQVLTDEQRQKLDDLLGKEFDITKIPTNILIPSDGK